MTSGPICALHTDLCKLCPPKITTMRLLKKAKKEHLIPLLEDFGVPTKGSKEELCTLLSEQVHYETDSGDDE